MKANELMIGDWVCADDGNAKVITIAMDGVLLKDENGICAASFDRINPISLTANILENNGIKFHELRFALGWNISYVHELQHGLRRCGIEKEIEL